MPLLYVGIHHPSMAGRLERTMLSVNTLMNRRSSFDPRDWIMDSGAFSRITSGRGHLPLREYCAQIERWAACGNLQAAVAQDYMCEPFVLNITGLSVEQHQRRSTRNYLRLRDQDPGPHIMPVLQGYLPEEYARHARAMSRHLPEGCAGPE